jgi:hypothetical protein
MKTLVFKDLFIGQFFFDPDCGEDFIKRSEEQAEMISGCADGSYDNFNPDDIVEINHNFSGYEKKI